MKGIRQLILERERLRMMGTVFECRKGFRGAPLNSMVYWF